MYRRKRQYTRGSYTALSGDPANYDRRQAASACDSDRVRCGVAGRWIDTREDSRPWNTFLLVTESGTEDVAADDIEGNVTDYL